MDDSARREGVNHRRSKSEGLTMPHYKLMYPSEYLAACDLGGKEVSVKILSVSLEEIHGADGRKETKPVVTFEKAKKRLVLCKTNAKAIAKRHGTDTDDWTGKSVTVYPTTCQAFGAEVECIRVR